MGDLLQDLRFSVRALARRPGFTALAIGVMALGISANVAIFALASRLFLEPPAEVAAPDELVRLFRRSRNNFGGSLSYPDFVDYRDGVRGLAELAAWSGGFTASGRVGTVSAQVAAAVVSENYFSVLGLRPAAGRFFGAGDNSAPGGHPIAVVSHTFWRERLGQSPDVVGRVIALNGTAVTVIGVTPAAFQGLAPGARRIDVYLPIMMREVLAPTRDDSWRVRRPDVRDNWLDVIGRLAPSGSLERTQAALSIVAARIYPPNPGRPSEGVFVTDQYRWFPGTAARLASLTRLMLAAVAALLLVAAVNVAVLLLVRASGRQREIGIRTAVGAGRSRMIRQFLTESVLLGLAGGTIGIGLSMAAARLTGGLLPVRIELPLVPDPRVLGFGVALSLLTAVLAGLVPALRASRTDPVALIQGRTRDRAGGRWRDGLVTIQVALSTMLLAGAMLLARSFVAARAVDVGFDPRPTLVITADLAVRQYDEVRGRALVQASLERIRAVPGVLAAAMTTTVPFEDEWSTTVEPWPGSTFPGEKLDVGLNAVTPDYFATLGIPILRGRGFEAADLGGTRPVAVINETFAAAAFAGTDPIGKLIPVRGTSGPPVEVIGIARNATYYDFGEAPIPFAYLSSEQYFRPQLAFLIRAAAGVDPISLAPAVDRAIHSLDPDLPFPSIRALGSLYDAEIAGYRASATVVGLAGLIALLLACAGLYGVMAFRVAERTREIGVRMALGASRREVARSVVLRGLGLTAAGIGIGLVGAVLGGRLIASQLYGVPARDPVSLGMAVAILLAVAAGATLSPSRRAMAVDPLLAIRSE